MHLRVLMQNVLWCQRILVLLKVERTIPFAVVCMDFALKLGAQPSQKHEEEEENMEKLSDYKD